MKARNFNSGSELREHYSRINARLRPSPVASLRRVPASLPVVSSAKVILREVADKHNLTIEQMREQGRTHARCRARDEAAYRLKIEAGLNLTAIGRHLNRDHASIRAAVERHRVLLQSDDNWRPIGLIVRDVLSEVSHG